jgi:hypothetical protein
VVVLYVVLDTFLIALLAIKNTRTDGLACVLFFIFSDIYVHFVLIQNEPKDQNDL